MKRIIILTLFLWGVSIFSFGQAAEPREQPKPRKYSMQLGLGVFQYVNTLKVEGDYVDGTQMGASFRIMREFEHRLAIGVESGYYRFYDVSKPPTSSNPLFGQATMTAVPILLNIRMRVVSDFYISGGTGVCLLYSKVTDFVTITKSNQFSLAAFHASALYLKPVSERILLGGELKFLNVAKTEDYGFSLQLIVSYRF
jgi:hypothetical protein